MRFQIEEAGCLECRGDRERNGMFIGWCPREEQTKVDELE